MSAGVGGNVTVVGSAPAMAQPIVQKTSAYDVLRRLLQSKNMMVSVNGSDSKHVYAAHLCLLQGDVAWDEVQRGIARLREARTVAFASCVPATYNAYVTKCSPYVRQAHRVSGLMLANHTSISDLLVHTHEQYTQMRKVNAYIEQFRVDDTINDMQESADVLDRVVQHYRRFARGTFA